MKQNKEEFKAWRLYGGPEEQASCRFPWVRLQNDALCVCWAAWEGSEPFGAGASGWGGHVRLLCHHTESGSHSPGLPL